MSRTLEIPSPGRLARLEKIPAAANRCGLSVSQFYRELKAGRVGPLVKVGARASAVPTESVDNFIAARIAESQGKGGAA